jgi:ribose-phosphate pyrophosphokinase
MSHLEPAKIFACSQSVYLAEKIAKEYGIPLGKSPCQNTVTVSFNLLTKNRGLRFIVCSTFPTADNLMEMLLMIDAAKRASARHITAVIPYFGWQDKIEKTSQGFQELN